MPPGHAGTYPSPYAWREELNACWADLLGAERWADQQKWSQWVSKTISSPEEIRGRTQVNTEPAFSAFPAVAYGLVTVTAIGRIFLTPNDSEAIKICKKGGSIAGRIVQSGAEERWVQAQAPQNYQDGMIEVIEDAKVEHPMYLLRSLETVCVIFCQT